MRRDLALVGSGGCMREILWQICEGQKGSDGAGSRIENGGEEGCLAWNVIGYVDLAPCDWRGSSEITVGTMRCPYLGDDDYLLSVRRELDVALCVGEPDLRKKIAEKLQKNPMLRFPNLILGGAKVCADVVMGKGCILSMDSRVSTNVRLGDFVFLNIGAMVCHDGNIGDFATLSPDVKLAGQVTVGSQCSLGMGTKVIQGVAVGGHAVVGAGSVVIRDVAPGAKVAGVPARRIDGIKEERPDGYR